MHKEKEMERNETNNWGNKMIDDDVYRRPRCPKCGMPCDDDGDRFLTRSCIDCDWHEKDE